MIRVVVDVSRERDFHRDALDDFHEISCGVFRGDNAEPAPGARLDRVHDAFKFAIGVRIHMDRDRLPGLHVVQLCFLEVSGHPDVGGDELKKLRCRRDVNARVDIFIGDLSVARRQNAAIAEINHGTLSVGLCLFQIALGGDDVRLCGGNLRDGGLEFCLCLFDVGLCLLLGRGGVVQLLLALGALVESLETLQIAIRVVEPDLL